MARLLQVFGFLSVLFRGATLTFQSLAVGGIVFLIFIVRRSQEDSAQLQQACLRWIRRSALALAVMQISYVLANSLILRESAEMPLRQVLGANFVLAGFIGIVAAFTVIALTVPTRSSGYTDLLLPAAAIIASSVMTSHSMARLDYRAPLVVFTALHQAAAATWLGGLPYLLIAIRRAPAPDAARQLSARFSQLALASVAVLASAGLLLSFAYVGSVQAIYGTSYGAMVATKALLFGLLLFLGALNFQLVRRGPASSIFASLSPRSPRCASPAVQELPEDIYAAQKKAFEVGSLSTESYVPGQTGTRLNTPAEKAWSEYNHHWAGIIVLSMGLLALLAQAGQFSWARNWPLAFFGLSAFLFLRSDPETWPLGPVGFWATLADPEILLHRFFALLVIALAVFEWRVQTGRVASGRARLVFPALIAVSGALLLTHSHSLGNLKEERLAELSHIPLAILAVTAGWSRWLELRLPFENQTRNVMARLWPLCIALIGVVLLNYREM